MTPQVVTYEVDDQTTVQFEIEPLPGFQPAGTNELIGKVQKAVEPAVAGARAVLDKVKEVRPDQVEVTFAVKVTGTMNWVVAKAATEGNFAIKLTWSAPSEGAD